MAAGDSSEYLEHSRHQYYSIGHTGASLQRDWEVAAYQTEFEGKARLSPPICDGDGNSIRTRRRARPEIFGQIWKWPAVATNVPPVPSVRAIVAGDLITDDRAQAFDAGAGSLA